jgi:hypothetical protein
MRALKIVDLTGDSGGGRDNAINVTQPEGGARSEFPAEDGPFANRVPTVITEHPSLANHPVTRNDKSNRIRAHGGADCTRRGRLVEYCGQSAIGGERAGRNTQQSAPDAHVKRRATHKLALTRRRLVLRRMRKNIGRQFLRALIAAMQFSIRPFTREQIERAVAAVSIHE